MKDPIVTVIVPTYNRALLIRETLDSISEQTYTNWECIVVDDGSKDNTKEILEDYTKKDSRFQYHHRPIERQKGANTCRNYGFELSKGKYIQFLDSDDMLEDFCLEERVSLVLKDASIDLLIRDTSFFKNNRKESVTINKDPKSHITEEYLRMFLRYEIPWTVMGGFYKRNIFALISFDEKLGRFQDISFNIKVLSQFHNLKLYRDFKIDSYYRINENKTFNNSFVKKVIKSMLIFNDLHSKLLKNNNYKKDLKKFNYKITCQYSILYFKQNRRLVNLIFMNYLVSNMYNLNQKLSIVLLIIFLNLNIYDFKNIGMYKFRSHFMKVMND